MVSELTMVESYPIVLENFGLAALSDLFDDRVIYRGLEPLDRKIPGLKSARSRLSLNGEPIPRKLEHAYAHAALFILEEAQERRRARLDEIVFIGDTLSGDGRAFQNLCTVGQRAGSAFIGDEQAERAAEQEADPATGIYVANRWSSLIEWLAWSRDRGLQLDENTAVVVDMDKTALGARGRNDRAVDAARLKGLYRTAGQILDDRFDARRFEQDYDELNQPQFHLITEDNQDYLAYICLVLNAGLIDSDELMEQMEKGSVKSFRHFVRWAETLIVQGGVGEAMRQVHETVAGSLRVGDPTPFKSFRRQEYVATLEAMNSLPDDVPAEERLSREITITQEVYEVSRWFLDRGCLVLSLSDKPEEASVPHRSLHRGMEAIHRAQTHCVGASIADRLASVG